jgi:hypothetical protein
MPKQGGFAANWAIELARPSQKNDLGRQFFANFTRKGAFPVSK